MDDKRQAALTAAYHEISASLRTTSDTRLRLVGLVPVASGVGIALLLNSSLHSAPRTALFLAVGLLGVLATAGIYSYELHQTRLIHRLFAQGLEIEGELEVEGYFALRPAVGQLGQWLMSAFLSAVAAGWMFIAFVRLNPVLAWGAAVLIFIIGLIVAWHSYPKVPTEGS